MHCPFCGHTHSEVIETRDSEDLDTLRRRRACLSCQKRFTTYERVENVQVMVVKRDGRREQFSREKLTSGLIRACEKTTVPHVVIEQIVSEVVGQVRSLGCAEVESSKIGQLISSQLKKIDKVAYIRFSSVFKRFVDIEDFTEEVKRLKII